MALRGVFMKLSFSTLGCPGWSWEEILRQAKALGFGGVEMRGVLRELDNGKIAEFRDGTISATAARLRLLGLAVPCLDTSVTFLGEGDFSETLHSGRASMDIAAKLGSPFIRVFGDRIPSGMGRSEAAERVAEGIKELARYGEGIGVTVLQETHGDFSDSRLIMDVFSRVQSPAAGILWDVANPSEFGETPQETWGRIGPLVRHVHMKDVLRRDGELVPCLPGDGIVPMRDVMRLLGEAGYQGWLSFEWEKMWHMDLEEPETAFPAFTKYILQLFPPMALPRP
jgi:sugar phosphate isomerase/epimerase